MSARFGPRNNGKRLLNRPLTVGEFLNVMGAFQRETDRKIWQALPWWKKVYLNATKRYRQSAARRTARGQTGQSPVERGERKTEGNTPGSGGGAGGV